MLASGNAPVGHAACAHQHVGTVLLAGNTCETAVCEAAPGQNAKRFRAKPGHDCNGLTRLGIGWDATPKVSDAAPKGRA